MKERRVNRIRRKKSSYLVSSGGLAVVESEEAGDVENEVHNWGHEGHDCLVVVLMTLEDLVLGLDAVAFGSSDCELLDSLLSEQLWQVDDELG